MLPTWTCSTGLFLGLIKSHAGFPFYLPPRCPHSVLRRPQHSGEGCLIFTLTGMLSKPAYPWRWPLSLGPDDWGLSGLKAKCPGPMPGLSQSFTFLSPSWGWGAGPAGSTSFLASKNVYFLPTSFSTPTPPQTASFQTRKAPSWVEFRVQCSSGMFGVRVASPAVQT